MTRIVIENQDFNIPIAGGFRDINRAKYICSKKRERKGEKTGEKASIGHGTTTTDWENYRCGGKKTTTVKRRKVESNQSRSLFGLFSSEVLKLSWYYTPQYPCRRCWFSVCFPFNSSFYSLTDYPQAGILTPSRQHETRRGYMGHNRTAFCPRYRLLDAHVSKRRFLMVDSETLHTCTMVHYENFKHRHFPISFFRRLLEVSGSWGVTSPPHAVLGRPIIGEVNKMKNTFFRKFRNAPTTYECNFFRV